MADRIHPSLKAVQSAGGGGSGDRVTRISKAFELAQRDDPVLLLREIGQGVVRSHFVAHSQTKGERG